MLFNRKDFSLKEDPEENLRTVLCLLGRAPIDVTLTQEELKNLKVPSFEDLRQLKTFFDQESVPTHPMTPKHRLTHQPRGPQSSDGSKRDRDVNTQRISSMTSTSTVGPLGLSTTDIASSHSETRSEDLPFGSLPEEMGERSPLSHADKEARQCSREHLLLASSEEPAKATSHPRSISSTSTVGPLGLSTTDTASSNSETRPNELPFEDILEDLWPLPSPDTFTVRQSTLSLSPLPSIVNEEKDLPSKRKRTVEDEIDTFCQEMGMELDLDLHHFPHFPELSEFLPPPHSRE